MASILSCLFTNVRGPKNFFMRNQIFIIVTLSIGLHLFMSRVLSEVWPNFFVTTSETQVNGNGKNIEPEFSVSLCYLLYIKYTKESVPSIFVVSRYALSLHHRSSTIPI